MPDQSGPGEKIDNSIYILGGGEELCDIDQIIQEYTYPAIEASKFLRPNICPTWKSPRRFINSSICSFIRTARL